MFKPRPKQQQVLAYSGGKMGVSAVPGSGKTVTLSYLAAQLVASGKLADDQEVLIVTLVNSAVNNFSRQVNGFVRERGLFPGMGYRVRTLHGLAHDIVRERPALVGLSENFAVIDERDANLILQDAVRAWVRSHTDVRDEYLAPDILEGNSARSAQEGWLDLCQKVASNIIRIAKDEQIPPAELRRRLEASLLPLPLAQMGNDIYADYQQALNYRGAVDFDDLIAFALQALRIDKEYCERLRYRWPYILEDEAQDSSRLQEDILRLLIGNNGNWVRVGDPNQAIYETFTTASPRYLREFIREDGVQARELPNSGRSTVSIISLANRLIDWTNADHPLPELRQSLQLPHIEPAPPDDSQPNPEDDPDGIVFVNREYKSDQEIADVVKNIAAWLPQHPESTVAVLVPRNKHGVEVAGIVRNYGLPYVELLSSTSATRRAAQILHDVLTYLAEPLSQLKLATVFKRWQRQELQDSEKRPAVEALAKAIQRFSRPENLLYPTPENTLQWPEMLHLPKDSPAVAKLEQFRTLVRRWLEATLLPIDQLLLTIAQDIFSEQSDLALAYKLALLLRRASENRRDWSLNELIAELDIITRNERKLIGFSDDDTGFDPERHRGKVVVSTMHKAKGLEWDRVYLLSVNSYDFPSAQPQDTYQSESWFVRDSLNLQAEADAQLRALLSGATYSEGEATQKERLEYSAERLRLLYVAITRARKELIITWNTGRRNDQRQATPLIALQTWWEEQGYGANR